MAVASRCSAPRTERRGPDPVVPAAGLRIMTATRVVMGRPPAPRVNLSTSPQGVEYHASRVQIPAPAIKGVLAPLELPGVTVSTGGGSSGPLTAASSFDCTLQGDRLMLVCLRRAPCPVSDDEKVSVLLASSSITAVLRSQRVACRVVANEFCRQARPHWDGFATGSSGSSFA